MDSKQINDLVKVDSNKYSNSDSKFEYGTFSNMNGKSGIYSIFNKITNKEYIGSTSNIGSRITKHFSELKLNKHTNHAMQDLFIELLKNVMIIYQKKKENIKYQKVLKIFIMKRFLIII